ncbi:hypothetical protein F5X68DRAFT_208096 [Plectosphaerella plurivora]|uniref:RING-type E3 ubiquitin transferase n=1 Tax=Plectosphaerella plurivora TaxID=936078 RepID=A0A9P8VBJ1_9PEZI|nr:hypothetical protein F5X68DRAFT_208096 [Plectosphaerella plurivora]
MSSAVAGLSADLSAADLRPAILRATLDQVSASTSTSEGEKDCCVICLGDIAEPCESQPCQHAHFDYLCLLTWLDQRKTCPLCKVPVTDVRHNFSPNREKWDTYKVPKGFAAPPKASSSEPHPSRDARPFGRRSRPPRTGRPYTPACASRGSDALARRRHIYRHRLFSLHVGTRQRKPHCDLTPASFVSNPDLVSRSRMFLRRELQVFEFLSSASDAEASSSGDSGARRSTDTGTDPRTQRRMANVEFLLEYIISILKTIDTQGCMGQAEALISPFLGREDTQLLLHELRAFLRSPYITLESWDRNVQYLSPSRSSPTRAGRVVAEGEPSDNIYPSVWRRGDPL